MNNYNIYTIKKRRSSKVRTIYSPKEDLKEKQKFVLQSLSSLVSFPEYIFGIKNTNYIQNAKLHKNKKYILKLDIDKFYDNITFDKFNHSLKILGLNIDNLNDIKNICFINLKDEYILPTGAPTSSIISIITFLPIDKLLKEYCLKHTITYSRYIDDLTFSSNSYIKYHKNKLINIIQDHPIKFSINKKKSKLLIKNTTKQIVTGVSLSSKSNIDKKYRLKLRAELDHQARNSLVLTDVLRGKLEYIRNLDKNLYNKYMDYFQKRYKFYEKLKYNQVL